MGNADVNNNNLKVCIAFLLTIVLVLFAGSCNTQEDGTSEKAGDYGHIDIQLYPNEYDDAFAVKDLLDGLGYRVVVGGSTEPDPEELSMENYANVYLVTESYECIFFQEGDYFIEGRQLNEQDIESGSNVCVVGRDIAPTLFDGQEDVLDRELVLLGEKFLVVGVYDYEGEETHEGEPRKFSAWDVFVPITAAKKKSDIRINYITVCIERGKDVGAEARKIYNLLKKEGYDITTSSYDCYDRPAGSIQRGN